MTRAQHTTNPVAIHYSPRAGRNTLFFVMLCLTFAGALAVDVTAENRDYVESRIYNTSNLYVINWSEDGQEYTVRDGWYGLRRVGNWTFWLKEIDPHLAQIIEVVDYETLRIKIVENPDDPNPTADLPLHACVNGTTIRGANRFRRQHDWCEGDNEYFLNRIPFNQWYTLAFDAHPTYEWWLGEGQGGGGNGLNICTAMAVSRRINQTSGNVTFSSFFEGRGQVIPAGSLGCSIDYIQFQYQDDTSTWRQIPQNNNSQAMDCEGVVCRVNTPTINVWYGRNVTCDVVKNVTLRTRMQYDTPSTPNQIATSATLNLECLSGDGTPPPTTINTSLRMGDLDPDGFNVTSNTYFPYINYTFTINGTNKTFALLSSYNIVKTTGGLTNELWANITVDGAELISERLRTVSKPPNAFDEGVAGSKPFLFNTSPGNHSVVIYFRRTGNGNVEVNDIDLILLQMLSNNLSDVNHNVFDANYQHNNTEPSDIYNFTYTSNDAPVGFWGRFTVSNTIDAVNTYTYENIATQVLSAYFLRHLEDSSDVGSAGAFWMDENLTGVKNYTIHSKVSGGIGTNNATMLLVDMRDNANNTIQHFVVGNSSTNVTMNLTLSAGTHLLTSRTLNITTGNDILLSASVTFKSNTTGQTPRFYLNSSSMSQADCYSNKERYLADNIDIGNAYLFALCKSTTLNVNTTFNFYAVVESGEQLIIYDETLTGVVGSDINFNEQPVQDPPDEEEVWFLWLLGLMFVFFTFIGPHYFDKYHGKYAKKREKPR